jgi:hypothetical protein
MSSTATDRPVAASHTSVVWASCPVEAPLLPARLHANLPALRAGRHLARDQVGLEVAGDHQAAVRAQAQGIRQRLETRELEHPGGGHRGRLRRFGAGREAERDGDNKDTHTRNSKGQSS